jgi:AraC-like DNA-binding protein
MNDLNIIQANLLLFGHDLKYKATRDRYHSHSCWQMELPHRGNMKAFFDSEALTVSSGDILIIPPESRHSFEYNSQAFSTWSLKFKLTGLSGNLPVRLLPPEPVFRQSRYFIEAAFKEIGSKLSLEKAQTPPPDFKQLVFIETIISALVSYAYLDNKKESFALAGKIRSIIKARNGKVLTVAEAAEQLAYSRSHLSLLFKQEYGVPLKTFIDQERIEIAKSLLAYTEMNISETAQAMGFNDVYYFSNFFKRLTGKSPLNYLKEI